MMHTGVESILHEVQKVIVGKDDVLEKILMTILSGGHVLLDDVPGTGKTTTALAFSRALGLQYGRIQFTPDVLPSDIVGFSLYRRDSGTFTYQPGAVMTNLLLADEINRTSSKTQSALLEVMEERACTVDGRTYPLPEPFAVIATQNPTGTVGTAALPVSQLDRFMIKLSMGYPDKAAMRSIMSDRSSSDPLVDVKAVCTAEKLIEMQKKAKAVFVDDSVYDYISDLCDATRHNENISLGVSPRGALALCRIAKAWACYKGREYVVPQDVRDFFVHVCSHRISLSAKGRLSGLAAESVLDEILKSVKCPENEEKRR